MTDHKTTLRQAQPRTSVSSTPQRSPILGFAVAAITLITAALEYVVTEAITHIPQFAQAVHGNFP